MPWTHEALTRAAPLKQGTLHVWAEGLHTDDLLLYEVKRELAPRCLDRGRALGIKGGAQDPGRVLFMGCHGVKCNEPTKRKRLGRWSGSSRTKRGYNHRVAQETLVYKVRPEHAALIEGRFDSGRFEFRSTPYARFSAKGEGVVVTLYTSGKLVVQGADPAVFVERYAPEASAVKGKKKAKKSAPAPQVIAPETITVGSDECGKGDFLGPLVVCAARMTPEEALGLAEAGVMDSKALDDKKALVLGAYLRERLEYRVVRLDPAEYNPRWRASGNLNELLGDLHAEAIRGLVQDGDHVIIDRFAKEELMERRLEGLEISLEQRPRAEEELCVAAASIIAREEFLLAMDELSSEWGMKMRKGAGPPVDAAAREFVRSFGAERLGEIAKLHFKNSKRVGAL